MLTKSKFKIGLDCPQRLRYSGKAEYLDKMAGNEFMVELAKGGYQVGELARHHYPDGNFVTAHNREAAFKETLQYFAQNQATVYEAAIAFENLFVRIDIAQKQGNTLKLIEVKSKSWGEDSSFTNKKGEIASEYLSYLRDIAYQYFVAKKAFPDWELKPYLLFVDKTKVNNIKYLNSFFPVKIREENGVKQIKVNTKESIPWQEYSPLLVELDVEQWVREIVEEKEVDIPGFSGSFSKFVEFLSTNLNSTEPLNVPIGKHCRGCSFKANAEERANGFRSGLHECWSRAIQATDDEIDQPKVFDVWNFRKSTKIIENGRYWMRDLETNDLSKYSAEMVENGFTDDQRRWLQISSVKENSQDAKVHLQHLKAQLKKFEYPYHFIDFETSMVALPFHKGRKPYELVAFQFSYHKMHQDGRIEHFAEYLNAEPGVFPNFEFVRALKAAIGDQIEGTFFKYAVHENTVMNQIIDQLHQSDEPDKAELIEYLAQFIHNSKANTSGNFAWVDMRVLVKNCVYHPKMGGSISIKKVLPSAIHSSQLIREWLLQPNYGSKEYSSKNFINHAWITENEWDPYQSLPKIEIADITDDEMMFEDSDIKHGGAAMAAYGCLQFLEMSPIEREVLVEALKKYCELDTFAMAVIMKWLQELAN